MITVFHVGKVCTGKRRTVLPAKKQARAASARAELNVIAHRCSEHAERVKNTHGRNQKMYTRGLYAWRVLNNTASQIQRTPLFGPAVYVPRGASSAYDIVPRLRTSRLSEWAIYVQHADGRNRPQLVRAGFRRACIAGDCLKQGRSINSCGRCLIGE